MTGRTGERVTGRYYANDPAKRQSIGNTHSHGTGRTAEKPSALGYSPSMTTINQ